MKTFFKTIFYILLITALALTGYTLFSENKQGNSFLNALQPKETQNIHLASAKREDDIIEVKEIEAKEPLSNEEFLKRAAELEQEIISQNDNEMPVLKDMTEEYDPFAFNNSIKEEETKNDVINKPKDEMKASSMNESSVTTSNDPIPSPLVEESTDIKTTDIKTDDSINAKTPQNQKEDAYILPKVEKIEGVTTQDKKDDTLNILSDNDLFLNDDFILDPTLDNAENNDDDFFKELNQITSTQDNNQPEDVTSNVAPMLGSPESELSINSPSQPEIKASASNNFDTQYQDFLSQEAYNNTDNAESYSYNMQETAPKVIPVQQQSPEMETNMNGFLDISQKSALCSYEHIVDADQMQVIHRLTMSIKGLEPLKLEIVKNLTMPEYMVLEFEENASYPEHFQSLSVFCKKFTVKKSIIENY